MKIAIAGVGGKPMLTGDIAGARPASNQFRGGILFAASLAENLSGLVLEHAAEITVLGPRRFLKRHKAEARTS